MTLERLLTVAIGNYDIHGWPNNFSELVPAELMAREAKSLTSREIRKVATLLEVPSKDMRWLIETRRCRNCGCTDHDCSQCIEKTGHPCFWVEPELCSACQG